MYHRKDWPAYTEIAGVVDTNGPRQEFFTQPSNILSCFLPDAKHFEAFIKVIEVPAVTDGKYAQVVADPRTQEALCFISGP